MSLYIPGCSDAVAWLGTVLVLGSRGLLVMDYWRLGFAIGAAGSVCWVIFAWRSRIWSLLVVDGVLLIVDLIGVARH